MLPLLTRNDEQTDRGHGCELNLKWFTIDEWMVKGLQTKQNVNAATALARTRSSSWVHL
jgi:hypothetical protein